MAVTGDVTFENGGKQIHPYVVALVRWCVSCLWSAATVVLHRIITTPQVPSIAAKPPTHSRAASKAHIHPEPLVQCAVLHEPALREVDFVFVHGLYGSLENTWRQGDWRSKYKLEPNKVPLRRPSSIPDACTSSTCVCNTTKPYRQTNTNYCICRISCEELDDNIKKEFIKSFNSDANKNNNNKNDRIEVINDKLEQDGLGGFSEVNVDIIDNYNMQADFVRKLFDCEAKNCSFGYKNKVDDEFKMENDEDYVYKISEDDEEFIDEISGTKQTCSENENVKLIHTENSNIKDEFNEDTQVTNGNDELYKENNELNEEHTRTCEIGCGCICDSCYSSCWPRDWLSKDFPNARIISINYTSDPYLWRPLWVKECKRLRLQERAMQMTSQLLELGVGEKPVVWVGHSKGGLFIKQIYSEAYEAYLKTEHHTGQNCTEYAKDNTINHLTEIGENENVKLSCKEQYLENMDTQVETKGQDTIESTNKDIDTPADEILFILKKTDLSNEVEIDTKIIGTNNTMNIALINNDFDSIILENIDKMDKESNNLENAKTIEEIKSLFKTNESEGPTINTVTTAMKTSVHMKTDVNSTQAKSDDVQNIAKKLETKYLLVTNELKTVGPKAENESIADIQYTEISDENYDENLIENDSNYLENIAKVETNESKLYEGPTKNESTLSNTDNSIKSKESNKKYEEKLRKVANLWKNSAGFMFYSVPHRGSALADIKTPLTARSVELLEISKDCSLVQSLQARWLRAVGGAGGEGGEGPAVRSLVETNRTLMAVLWLRIVSVESADAGIGALCGVSVDHREICKPSSRSCVLYTELLKLIHAGLDSFQHRA